jgi:hypothetical protein
MAAARVVVVLVFSVVHLLGGLLAAAAPVLPPKEEEKNVVEKDGVRFEVVVPQRTWAIPEDKPAGAAPVKLALRITNRTKSPLRFTRFDTLTVEMVGPDGKDLQSTAARKGTRAVQEADCPLAKPGESVVFDIDAHLSWRDGKLWFGGADGFGGGWGFASAFGPGRYQLRIRYRDATTERTVVRGERSVLDDFWTGDVRTPLVEVVLAVSK